MRTLKIAPGEHYHIFNRAALKQVIFHDFGDYARFLFLILYLQAPIKILHINRLIKSFLKFCSQTGQSRALTSLAMGYEDEVVKKRRVEIVTFCIMPNHFHLILKELDEGGISFYMQRVLTAYAKYYNTKYQKTGHVFQGPYRAVHVESNEQLLHLSTYIHRNPREIAVWLDKEHRYPWSSHQDLTEENRWGNLMAPEIILGQFKDKEEYAEFVRTSTAKELDLEPKIVDLVKAEL
jgi:putative transposase